jgi:peptidyl-prolyl cis-trans isomerase D
MALGFMRRHRRWLYVFLWLVIAAFIILYIPAFQGAQAGSPGEVLAVVGDLPITVGEYQKSYLRQRQVYERMYQGRLDPQMLRRLGLEEQVFSSLVADRLVVLEAERLGVAVDDEAVAREIATAPEYQRDGKFVGTAEIRRLLELRGMSVEEFEGAVRADLQRRKLEALVAGGVLVSDAEAEREYRRRSEQLKAEYVLVDAARFASGLEASEEEIKARFDARKDDYRIPERRVLDYVLIDGEKLRAQVAVTEADLQAEYAQRREEFKQEEQACASHILVKVKAGEAGEGHSEADAQRIAQGVLEELRKGADFAAVARRASEDKGSAASGGDLGCFPRGAMLPEFEDAAYALEPGQLSPLVRTQYGFHVIKLASRRAEDVLPLGAVKERLREGLIATRTRELAGQHAEAVAARLAKGASLQDAATAVAGLQVVRSAPIARAEPVAPLASPRLVARAFEMKQGETEPEAFGLSQGLAFIGLVEIQAPRLPGLDEVRERVKADVVDQKARERARAAAAELRARAQQVGLDKAAQAMGLVRKETPNPIARGQALGDLGASAALDEAVFALPEKTLSDPIAVQAGAAVVRVLEHAAFDSAAFARQKDAIVQALRQERRQRLFDAFLEEARKRVAIERRAEAFRRVVG